MPKIRNMITKLAQKLQLPVDIAAELPHMELNGFCECALDCHTGILEYEKERIVVAMNIGTVTILGENLELRQMHRERLCVRGTIRQILLGGNG